MRPPPARHVPDKSGPASIPFRPSSAVSRPVFVPRRSGRTIRFVLPRRLSDPVLRRLSLRSDRTSVVFPSCLVVLRPNEEERATAATYAGPHPVAAVVASAASSERQIPTVSKAIIRSAARPRFRIFTARSHSRTTAAHLPVHTPPRAFRSTSSAVPSAPARAAFRTFALSVPDSFSSSIRGPERFTSTLFPKTAPGSRFPTPRPPSAPTDSPVRLSAPALPFRAPGLPFPPAFVQTTRQTARRKPVAAERRAGGRRQIPRPAEYRNVYGTVLRMKLLCRKNCRLGDNADDSQRDGPQLRFP